MGINGIGISTLVTAADSTTKIINAGRVSGGSSGILATSARGTAIFNKGDISAGSGGGGGPSYGTAIGIVTNGIGSDIHVENSGTVEGLGVKGVGISTLAAAADSMTEIINSGSIYGSFAAIPSNSEGRTKIVNSGDISAASSFAIGVNEGSAAIYNAGRIAGYVVLDANDTFVNSAGGVFETKLTSDFGPGSDLFRNENGGTKDSDRDKQHQQELAPSRAGGVGSYYGRVDETETSSKCDQCDEPPSTEPA